VLKNLNPQSFRAFGRVFDRTPAAYEQQGLEECVISPQTEDPAYLCCAADVFLSCRGMTALITAGSQGAEAFYLDRITQISAGVRFRLCPLGDSCSVTVRKPEGSTLQRVTGPTLSCPLTMEPGLTVQRIYTLMHQEQPKGFYFHGESHSPYELVYMNRGSMHCILNGRKLTLQPNDVLVIPPDCYHVQYSDPDTQAAFTIVSFDMACRDSSLLEARIFRATPEMIRQLHLLPDLAQNADLCVLELCRTLLLLQSLAHSEAGSADAGAAHHANDIVNQAIRYIDANLGSRLTVETVAKGINISAPHLYNRFHQQLKMGPAAYIRKTRLEESRKMIRQGDRTIGQIAQLLGFSTLQLFSSNFKAYFGYSPREYAQRVHAPEPDCE